MKQQNWDCYTRAASHRSSQWAASDRGWLFAGDTALGNYLDYGNLDYCIHCSRNECACEQPQGKIHAAVYFSTSSRARASRWCSTVEEAKAWIEQEALTNAAA